MRVGKLQGRKTVNTRRSEAVILFAVASTTFAISAAAVEEIRSAVGLRPLACDAGHGSLAKVRHTVKRGRKEFLVVDAAAHFHTALVAPTRLLMLRNSRVAVAVESIDRMAEIHALYPLPAAFRGDERRWYRGLALVAGRIVPVVDPDLFLSRAEQKVVLAGASLELTGAVSA